MAIFDTSFRASYIPDPNFLGYRHGSGGVREVVWDGFEQLARFTASLPVGSVKVSIQFSFHPNSASGHPQDRLHLALRLQSNDPSISECVRAMVKRGSISQYYGWEETESSIDLQKYSVGCRVLRHHVMEDPVTPKSMNARIPDQYFSPRLFKSRADNDFLGIEKILSGIREPVLIHIGISPTDPGRLICQLNQYLRNLQQLGRSWGGVDDSPRLQDLFPADHNPKEQAVRLKPHQQPDETAQWVVRGIQKVRDELHAMRLAFECVVLCEEEATAHLLGSSLAESAFEEGQFSLQVCHSKEKCIQSVESPNIDLSSLTSPHPDYKDMTDILGMASVDELKGVFRLPVAGQGIPSCIRRNTDPIPINDPSKLLVGWECLEGGGGEPVPSSLSMQALTRHMFISGSTGSGKSTALIQLMLQLHDENIPFILLEPVKTEFRSIKQSRSKDDLIAKKLADHLRVFSPGNEGVSPMRWNPLAAMQGITPLEHQDELRMSMRAAVPMSGSLPAIIEEGLEDVFNEPKKVPNFQDLVTSVKTALKRKGYSASTQSDFMGAVDARLGSMTRGAIGRVFDCHEQIPDVEQLMNHPSVIEMDRLSSESRCLLTLFLLVSIREYIRIHPSEDGKLRYVLIIDEAHNLVGTKSESQASEDSPDAGAHASEYLCRMLAEMRSQGVGVIVCDQVPSAVAPEVIKHTVTKLAFQQTHEEDRATIGASMLFTPSEYEDIGRLRPGEAYLFTGGYYRSRKIRTVNVHESMDLGFLPDPVLVELLSNEHWFQEIQMQRMGSDLAQFDAYLIKVEMNRSNLLKMMAELVGEIAQGLAGRAIDLRNTHTLQSMHQRCRHLSRQFEFLLKQLKVRHSKTPENIPTGEIFQKLRQWKSDQVIQIKAIQRDTCQYREFLQNKAKACHRPQITQKG
jgi:hypothetical protein